MRPVVYLGSDTHRRTDAQCLSVYLLGIVTLPILYLCESTDSYTFIDNFVLIALVSFGSTALELGEENIVRNHIHLDDGANCETNQKNEDNTRPKTYLVLRNLSFADRCR